MDEQNNLNNGENGFQDPTVTPVQPDAAVSVGSTEPVWPMNQPNNNAATGQPVPPVQTPPTYEQYAAQQAAAQQAQQAAQQNPQSQPPYQTYQPQNGGYNPQYGGQYNQPPYQNFQPNVQPISPNNGMATASLIVGIVSLICCGLPAGIVAIILGAIGLSKSKTMCGNGKGMAIVGIILGVVSIVFSIAMLVLYLFGFAAFQNYQYDYDYSTDFYSMIRMYLPF